MTDQREFPFHPNSRRIALLSASGLVGFGLLAHILIGFGAWPIVGGIIIFGLQFYARDRLALRLHHDRMEVRPGPLAGCTTIRYADITGVRLGSRSDAVEVIYAGAGGVEARQRLVLSALDTEVDGVQFKELVEHLREGLQPERAAA